MRVTGKTHNNRSEGYGYHANMRRVVMTVTAIRRRLEDDEVACLVGEGLRTPEQLARLDLIMAPYPITYYQSAKTWAGVAKGDQGLWELIDRKYSGWSGDRDGEYADLLEPMRDETMTSGGQAMGRSRGMSQYISGYSFDGEEAA